MKIELKPKISYLYVYSKTRNTIHCFVYYPRLSSYVYGGKHVKLLVKILLISFQMIGISNLFFMFI